MLNPLMKYVYFIPNTSNIDGIWVIDKYCVLWCDNRSKKNYEDKSLLFTLIYLIYINDIL